MPIFLRFFSICMFLLASLFVTSCGGDGDGQRDSDRQENNFNYYPPTAVDIAQAKAIVSSRDLSPRDIQVVYQGEYDNEHFISILDTPSSRLHITGLLYIQKALHLCRCQ